jgi:pimeloyl-ACP methyl ester carboxylesterase
MAPTLVIVPGSFATPAMYDGFIAHLKKSGVEDVRIVHTPSVGPFDDRKPGNVSDDVAAITKVVDEALSEGKEVTLIAHSYGGIPTSQSLKQLGAVNRSDGKGVKKVIYLASVILQEGVSNFELFGNNLPDFLKKHVSAPVSIPFISAILPSSCLQLVTTPS